MTSYGNNSIITSNNGTSTLELSGNLLINPSYSTTAIIGIKCGTATFNGGNPNTFTFNNSFPTSSNIVIHLTPLNSSNNVWPTPSIVSLTTSGFVWYSSALYNGNADWTSNYNYSVYYIAICYA